MKIASIVGARPQFIKAAVMSKALRDAGMAEVLIHTGQHYDDNMSDIFFQELEIPTPAVHLGVGSAPHGEQTGRMLRELELFLMQNPPDCVLVYGDTNSTLAGALAAVKLHIPVAHIEAGLRSYNRRMPEEINRILTDHASDMLFAPTDQAVRILRQEGIPDGAVHQVGDVMYDAALHYGRRADENGTILQQLALRSGQYLLATLHRAENTDDAERLRVLFSALQVLATEFPVVFPVHPRTRTALQSLGLLKEVHPDLVMIEPVGYLNMVMLEKNARLIMTDSGGVQKEAFFHRIPCVTTREETEWVELVEAGWNRLAPPNTVDEITGSVRRSLKELPPPAPNLYGDGQSCRKIANILQTTRGNNPPRAYPPALRQTQPGSTLYVG